MPRICIHFRHFTILVCCLLLMTSAERLAAQPAAVPATAQATSTLTVTIVGVRNANGKIRMTLYRDSKLVEERDVDIDAQTMSAKAAFGNIPQGTYAVYLLHDENMNGKMDANWMGMPVEGYGMSNNPAKRMGRPGFDETNFPVNHAQCGIEIRMIYWQ